MCDVMNIQTLDLCLRFHLPAYTQEGEAYHQLKIQLELEAQAKDAEAEALRAAGGFDADRLLHDRRRLLERAGAMGLELAAQRKRLARLKEVVDGLAARFHEHDGRERKRFEELTLECARLRRQYRDLQRRFRHFIGADRERYDKVRCGAVRCGG